MRSTSSLATLVPLMFAITAASAQGANPGAGVDKLLADTGGAAKVSIDSNSGNARFVRLPTASGLSIAPGRAEDQAADFFRTYGSAFGVSNVASELKSMGTMRDSNGSEHAIFEQTYQGLPVFAGELRAHFNANGNIYAANGVFLSDLNINTTPSIAAKVAAERAIRTVLMQESKAHIARGEADEGGSDFDADSMHRDLNAVANELMVFRSGVVQGVAGRDHLVYRVEVSNGSASMREFVFVDAHKGNVVEQITGVHDVLDRRAFDAEGSPHPGPNYPGSPFWVEGDPLPTSDVEADNMIFASAESYDLFLNAFVRDSFDGAGATMDAIFNRGDSCPNASWNGTYISFCPGLTTDDVTAHEWGHAYTEKTNNLIYQWQSGALNESYSDIWGETVDLINGRGLDSPGSLRTDGSCSVFAGGGADNSYRWLMGEEVSTLPVLRDMWSPTCLGDPGKVSDTVYRCSTADQGGVHSNSGVPNHAFALMVDGGTYNSYSGSGLGLTKSVHVQWAASIMLTPASNFVDNANALEAACDSLVGVDLADLLDGSASGEMIAAEDCNQVAEITAAVEFRTPPDQCGFTPMLDPDAPALCEVGDLVSAYVEDFEGGTLPAGWVVGMRDELPSFSNPGWSVVDGLPTGAGGTYAALGPDPILGDCAADSEAGVITLDSPATTLGAGVPRLAIDHWVATEAGWDGGNIKISVNDGPWELISSANFSFNPYNAAINGGGNDNPLAGEAAFTGTDGGNNAGSWGQSQVNLLGIAGPGDTVSLRFEMGTDGCNGLIGWYVDKIESYSCSTEAPGVCGDSLLDLGEACDDGNAVSGDGCSSSCQVEEGFSCTLPIPPGNSSNAIVDGSFEGGVPNADWTPSSTFGDIDGFPLCGPGNGCPAASLANTGAWLIWIGGLETGVTSSVDQVITIPVTATELTLQSWRGLCDDPSDTLHVSLDGTDIGTVVCDAVDGAFVEQTFPLAPFNDGGDHTLLIGGTVGGTNATHSNIFVDDVAIEDNVATPPQPSMCSMVAELACNGPVVDFNIGLPGTWSVVDNTAGGPVWTNIAGSGIGSNTTGGSGDAASVNSDAFGAAAHDTELRSNSFSLAGTPTATLTYKANYQNLNNLDFLELDVSTDGGGSWSNLLSWNENHGGFFALPGETVNIDLAAYAGEADVQLRWRYYDPNAGADFNWYAQVDDVSLACAASDQDGDGVPDSSDNCILVPNPTQCDGDGDNYGNHCDGDFNNDLIINGLDVGPLKAGFGTADPVTDLNCDGITNGLDIGPFKAMFGGPPGPSGLAP